MQENQVRASLNKALLLFVHVVGDSTVEDSTCAVMGDAPESAACNLLWRRGKKGCGCSCRDQCH
jgi:hypothetical protein